MQVVSSEIYLTYYDHSPGTHRGNLSRKVLSIRMALRVFKNQKEESKNSLYNRFIQHLEEVEPPENHMEEKKYEHSSPARLLPAQVQRRLSICFS